MAIFKNLLLVTFVFGMLGLTSCKDEEVTTQKSISIQFDFLHKISGEMVIFDSLLYTNEAGNRFEVTEIQWFISDIQFLNEKSTESITTDDNIHYVDTNIPESQSWFVDEVILPDTYTHINFTFGIKGEKNTVGRFTDPPEVNMIWPYHMGGDNGGYHYMKLNGFWVDPQEERQPFNFHLGVGSVEEDDGSTTFIQNWFEVSLPVNIDISAGRSSITIPITMNIENWFRNPNTWDHDLIGPKIMKNQNAMGMGIDNGRTDVFSIGTIAFPE